MKKNISGMILGVLCILGAFLPMAQADQYFVGIGHIGGLSYLLYPLSLAEAGLVITAIYKPYIRYLRVWIGLAAVLGVILAGLSIQSGMNHLEYIVNSMSRFSMFGDTVGTTNTAARIGTGGLMAVSGYVGFIFVSIMPVWSVAQKKEI